MAQEKTSSQDNSGQQAAQVIDHIEVYKLIAEWIRFADTKAAATLTVNGVLLGLLVPTLKAYLSEKTTQPTEWGPGLVSALFVIWLVLLVASAAYSFQCILPIRGSQRRLTLDRAAHFHPAAIAQHYTLDNVERFIEDSEKAALEGLNREVLAGILIDSHLSNAKYACVSRSVWLLAGSVVFGSLYLLAIQV